MLSSLRLLAESGLLEDFATDMFRWDTTWDNGLVLGGGDSDIYIIQIKYIILFSFNFIKIFKNILQM